VAAENGFLYPVVFLLFTAAGAWLILYLRRAIAIGAAYKAKVLCTAIFGSKRDLDPARADDVSAGAYWILRAFRARIDRVERSVTATIAGRAPRTAIYRPGLGATLTYPGRLRSVAIASIRTGSDDGPFPFDRGDETAAVRNLVDATFTEPDSRRPRRTRAIVIVKDGRIVAERYAPGFSAEMPLPGWSMTKSVIGALIGILVGEGRLSLDDQALLPEWPAGDARSEIRLEDLLRMRSGLRFSESYFDMSSNVNQMLFNRPDAAAYAASQRLRHKPGTAWSYSSGTTNILSRIIRRVVGEADYPDFPRRALFDRIGMSSAAMEPDASGTFVGSSFMLATPRDWARFGQLHLHGGTWRGQQILPEGWVRFATTPTPQSPGGCYGAHWWLKLQKDLGGESAPASRIPDDAFFALGHEGQTLSVIPASGLVVVRLGLSINIEAWNHAAFLADLHTAI
jgi:CubicO group peptidase (beta-lactamase class C family)